MEKDSMNHEDLKWFRKYERALRTIFRSFQADEEHGKTVAWTNDELVNLMQVMSKLHPNG